MIKAKDLRSQAWTALSGKWGTMALCTLIYELILGVCGGLSVVGIGAVILLVVEGPLAMGVTMLSLSVIRGQDVKIEGLFDGFKNFVSVFLLALTNAIFIALWSLLFVIPGIIKSLSYSMSYFILADHPELSFSDARKQSMVMMHGHKWRLFCLEFSFIGWGLLCVLTLGILTFWVTPYRQAAIAAFYQDLLIRNGAVNVVASPEVLPETPAEPFAEEAPVEEPVEENNTDAE